MAISPAQLGRLTSEESAKVEELERDIDAYLSRLQQPSGSVRYTFSGQLTNGAVRREIEKRYREAGWSSVRIIESGGASVLLLGA
jgi:hypothetical protein